MPAFRRKMEISWSDLDSTNGTFIDDKRLRPGVPATVLPANYVIFGTIQLTSPNYIILIVFLENLFT